MDTSLKTVILISLITTSISASQLLQPYNRYIHPPEIGHLIQQYNSTFGNLSKLQLSEIRQFMLRLSDPEKLYDFLPSAERNITDSCNEQLMYWLDSLYGLVHSEVNNTWPEQMIDSWGKPGAGLYSLKLRWIGDYLECLSISVTPNKKNVDKFGGKYCFVSTMPASSDLSGLPVGVGVGVCMPSGCTAQDVTSFIQRFTDFLSTNLSSQISASCPLRSEEMELSSGATATIVVYSIFGVLCLIGTLYDIYFIFAKPKPAPKEAVDAENSRANGDLTTHDRELLVDEVKEAKPGVVAQFFLCFSIYSNGCKILNMQPSAESLGCLHGIRVISMFWVILGHTVFSSLATMDNFLDVLPWINEFGFQAISNAFVAVDSFFVLSGLLSVYVLLKQFEKSKLSLGKFLKSVPIMYLHRYIRLTPAYGFMIMFYTYVTLYLFDGPLKGPGNIQDEFCVKYAWTNLLYMNNIVHSMEQFVTTINCLYITLLIFDVLRSALYVWLPSDTFYFTITKVDIPKKAKISFNLYHFPCTSWSWYLANDFQFYLTTPFVAYLYHRSQVIGAIANIMMIVVSCAAGTGISVKDDLGVTLFGARVPNDSNFLDQVAIQNDELTDLYYAPWVRFQSFGVGMLFGFILFKCYKKHKIHWIVNLVGWAVSAITCLLVLYGPYDVQRGAHIASVAEAAFYNGWSRTAWSVGMGYVILACCLGSGGWVNEFLSWPGFLPLSRLTYCAYLLHPVVMVVFFYNGKNLITWDKMVLAQLFTSFILLTYGVAFVYSLVFEAPWLLLDKNYMTGLISRKRK